MRHPPRSLRRLLSAVFAAIALCAPISGHAGRPVIEELTLSALATRADWVVVATLAGSVEAKTDTLGCTRQYWPLQVNRVLKAPDSAASPSRLRVLVNVTATRDCGLRARKGAGASFAAARYSPSAPPPRLGETRVVFAIVSDGDVSLVAEQSWESAHRIDEIERLLSPPRPSGSTR